MKKDKITNPSEEASVEEAVVPTTADNAIEENAESASPADASTAKKARTKRIVGLTFTCLCIAIVLFLLFVVGTLAVDKFIKKSPVPSFFGTSALIVTTGSMSGTIEEGDLVIVKRASEYKIGDIVTFVASDNTGDIVTHRIIQIRDGKFITRGDANNAQDPRPISEEDIVGKVTGTIPRVGLFFKWLVNEFGWVYIVGIIVIIAVGVVLLKMIPAKKEN